VSLPSVVSVTPDSPAWRAGIVPGDQIVSIDGVVPRDVIDFAQLLDGANPELELARGGMEISVPIEKLSGEKLGAEISDALFDRVRTCDNHCEFCFIYQLPKGLRRTLYVKDDDYRLSFLYGNFTTLTRFTEADLERVVVERLSPLYVSIHATDPKVRSEMLRNSRGGTSLRWLEALLARGIEVHGQIVLAPGVNDGQTLVDTLIDLGLEYSALSTVGVVPLGVSRYTKESRMRAMTQEEAARSLDTIEAFQELFVAELGRPFVFASDEFYLLADRPFPPMEFYGDFDQRENGVGIARGIAAEFHGERRPEPTTNSGFFASIDGAPALGYRGVRIRPRASVGMDTVSPNVGIISSPYGTKALGRLFSEIGRSDIELIDVPNKFFGGNIAVAGLMAGQDIAGVLEGRTDLPSRLLLPDVCLSEGRFIDGLPIEELPKTVEVVPTNGLSLSQALSGTRFPAVGG